MIIDNEWYDEVVPDINALQVEGDKNSSIILLYASSSKQRTDADICKGAWIGRRQ